MIEFETARQAVADYLRDRWDTASLGKLVVAEYGYDDDAAWMPVYGPKASIVDGDTDAVVMDQPILLVDKRTGAVSEFAPLECLERVAAMREYGPVPA